MIPYIFPNKDRDNKIKRFTKSWNTTCKKAGIGNRLFHDFRSTAVRNMVRADITERVSIMV